jgi:hypothetical protein
MTNKENDLVITPGGPRPRAMVHTVKSGGVIRRNAGGTSAGMTQGHLHSARLKAMLDSGNFIITPGGPRRRELVHVMKPNEAVMKAESGFKKLNLLSQAVTEFVSPDALQGAQQAFGSGWITYASWVAASSVTIASMTTTWTVPPKPTTETGQLIYLFNGLQDNPITQILQPVLQWGISPDGGGPFWSVASWFVDPVGHAFKSPSITVIEGDTLTGVMILTGQSSQGFNYSCEFAGISETTLRAVGINLLVNAVETLECYGIQSCTDYPNTLKTTMAAIGISTAQGPAAPNFAALNDVTDCGQHTVVVSNATGNSEVDLYYHQGAGV